MKANIKQAEPDLPRWDGRLVSIYISAGHDYRGRTGQGHLHHGLTDVDEIECVAGMGLRGDRYFGYKSAYKGQATFFDEATLEEIRRVFKLSNLPASVFRRNLIVQGIAFKKWVVKRFRFQGVEFEGCQECKPCDWMDRAVAPDTEEFMKSNFRGRSRARILSNGILRLG